MSANAATQAPPQPAPAKKEGPVLKSHYREDDDLHFRPITAAMLWRLAGLLKPYKRLYILGALSGLSATLLSLAGPTLQQKIIDHVAGASSLKADPLQPLIDWLSYNHALSTLAVLVILWTLTAGMSLLLDAVQLWATQVCGERVITDLRNTVFRQLQRLPMSFYDRTKLGRIITHGTSDMDALRAPVVSGINTIALNTLMMVGAAVMIFWTDTRLFLATFWMAPVLGICNHFYRQKIGTTQQQVRAGFSRVSSNLAENITGVRVVSAFNRQEENLERFNELQNDNTDNNIRHANVAGIYQPFLNFIKFTGQVVILAYGGLLAIQRELTPGEVIKVFFYWEFFMNPTINMGNFYNQLMAAMASCERIFGLLDRKPELQDLPDAKPLPRLKGHVRFEHVTFGYDPERPVLHDISLEIPAGKTYALVGATGSGKSSTVSLLARFYEFQQGSITVDGSDIRNATVESLHKQMGLVLQVNYLFTGTILDNIRYPRPEATDDEVYAAAKSLGLHETFLGLPDGYMTTVGERGASVSLGLRQLICFTRVLLANPSLFLLDEATSSIDTVTEAKVQSALEKLVQGRTTIIVAHRLSTIVKADCIVVLEMGKIIEQGTHAELLAKHGHYAGLYERFISHQSDGPIKDEGPVIQS